VNGNAQGNNGEFVGPDVLNENINLNFEKNANVNKKDDNIV